MARRTRLSGVPVVRRPGQPKRRRTKFERDLHNAADRLYALAKVADRLFGIPPGRSGSDVGNELRTYASGAFAVEVKIANRP